MTWPAKPPTNTFCASGTEDLFDFHDGRKTRCPDVAKETVKTVHDEVVYVCVYHAQRLAKVGKVVRNPVEFPPNDRSRTDPPTGGGFKVVKLR